MKFITPKNKPKFKAFTLIELLVIFGIIAILGLIGVPAYNKYRIRAKLGVMVSAASAAKLSVVNDYFNQNNSLTNIDYAAGSQPFLVPQSSFITSIAIVNGVVTVTGNASDLGDRAIVLRFTPTVVGSDFTWTCATDPSFYEFAPEQCHNPI